MAICEYFTCESDDGKVKIKSLVIKDGVVPAVTICDIGNAKLIQEATVDCSEPIETETEIDQPIVAFAHIGMGSFYLNGSAPCCLNTSFIGSGNITFSSNAFIAYEVSFIPSGSLTFNGSATFTIGANHFYDPSGSLIFGGTTANTVELPFVSTGQSLTFNGSSVNTIQMDAIGTGGLTFGSSAVVTIQIPFETTGQSLTFGGTSVNSVGISVVSGGGIEFSGGELIQSDVLEIFDGLGTPPLPDYILAGDGHVVKIGTQWRMFLSSLKLSDAKIYDHQATLADEDPLSTSGWSWNTGSPVISPSGSASDWDHTSIETPTYVYGYDNTAEEWVERIYYTGWRTAGLNPGGLSNYSIGYAQWNGASWVKYTGNPVLSLTNTVTYGQVGGDQGVVYDSVSNMWWMFYQEATEEGYTILKRASSKDGVVWRGKEQVEFGPPNAPVNLPNGPYHIDVQIIDGLWYYVGWLPRSPMYNQGLWATISYGPAKQRAGDFHYWIPLIYERQNGPSWFALTDLTKQAIHDIGLFSACLAKEGSTLLLFYLITIWNGSSNVGSQAVGTMSNDLLAYDLAKVSEYNTYTAYGYTFFSGSAPSTMSLGSIGSGGLTFSNIYEGDISYAFGPGGVTQTNMTWASYSSITENNDDIITTWNFAITPHGLGASAAFFSISLVIPETPDPTVVDPGINGLKSISFVDGLMFGSYLFASDVNTFTIFTVARMDESVPHRGLWGLAGGDFWTAAFGIDGTQDCFALSSDLDASGDARLLTLGPTAIAESVTANHIFCTKINHATGLVELWIDGRLHGKSILAEVGSIFYDVDTSSIIFGFGQPDGWTFWNDLVGDFVSYPTILNSTQQQEVENSLASTYGITLRRIPSPAPAIYLDASMLLHQSNTSTTSYTNAVIANSQTVGSMKDVLDNTKELTQATANKRPTVSLTGGYLTFDVTSGQEDGLVTTGYGSPPTSGDLSLVLLLKIAAGVTFDGTRIISHEVSGNIGVIQIRFGTTGRMFFCVGRDVAGYRRYVTNTPNSTVAEDETYLVIARFNDTAKTWAVDINNSSISVSTSNDTTGLSFGNYFYIGSNPVAGTMSFDFYSFMRFDRYLSNQECIDLYGYFQQRAAI